MELLAPNGKLVGKIGNGQDFIGLHIDGRSFYSTVNGCRVTESNTRRKFMDHAVPVVALAAVEICKQNPVLVWKTDRDQGAMDEIRKHLDGKIDDAKVTVLTLPPDEQQDSGPREMKASVPNLQGYRDSLPDFAEPVNKCRELADGLLRTNIPKTMWGGKKIQGYLNGIRADLDGLQGDFDRFDATVEHSERNLHMASAVNDRKSSSVIAGRLIEGFRDIKDTMSKTAQVTYRLFDADRTFKKEAGYPATWFFPPSVYYDFLYNFESLVKGIVKAASLEMSAIMPLFAWRVQAGDQR